MGGRVSSNSDYCSLFYVIHLFYKVSLYIKTETCTTMLIGVVTPQDRTRPILAKAKKSSVFIVVIFEVIYDILATLISPRVLGQSLQAAYSKTADLAIAKHRQGLGRAQPPATLRSRPYGLSRGSPARQATAHLRRSQIHKAMSATTAQPRKTEVWISSILRWAPPPTVVHSHFVK
jgi:hypothetical protein